MCRGANLMKPADAVRRAWALSEVRVQRKACARRGPETPSGERARAVDAAKEAVEQVGAEHPVRDHSLCWNKRAAMGKPWRGAVLRETTVKPRRIIYDTRLDSYCHCIHKKRIATPRDMLRYEQSVLGLKRCNKAAWPDLITLALDIPVNNFA